MSGAVDPLVALGVLLGLAALVVLSGPRQRSAPVVVRRRRRVHSSGRRG